jgi:hypothetical protein
MTLQSPPTQRGGREGRRRCFPGERRTTEPDNAVTRGCRPHALFVDGSVTKMEIDRSKTDDRRADWSFPEIVKLVVRRAARRLHYVLISALGGSGVGLEIGEASTARGWGDRLLDHR